MNPVLRACVVASLLLCPAVGQIDPVRGAFGVTMHAGVVRGLGPDYSARFEPGGVAFTPLLGSRVDTPKVVRFALTSVQRGSEVIFARSRDVVPSTDGNQVRYEHDANLVERYEVRRDGIEQSFVFTQRPPGDGDLVVRGELTTDLPLVAVDGDGARFELAGAGGVTFGAVTGIDANGARRRGCMRCDGRHLELSLPASFVDAAAYPLVLDPLIGSSFLIANVANSTDVLPSLAYDETTQRYLVVWHAVVSSTVAEVRAQFVNAAGLLGPQLLIAPNSVAGVRPVVANINQRDRFVVAWAGLGSAEVTTVAAATGAVTGSLSWVLGQPLVGLAIGGDSRTPLIGNADHALLMAVTHAVANPLSSVSRMTIQVPASGFATVVAIAPITTVAAQCGPPAVTKHGGSQGRWLTSIAYRYNGQSNGACRLDVVDAVGTVCDTATQTIAAAPNNTPRSAVAALDGSAFLFAYEDSSTIRLRRVQVSSCGATMVLLPVFSVTLPGLNEYPELDCARDKYLLAWRNTPPAATVSDVYVQGIGLQNGVGAVQPALGALATQIDPAVASRWSGGDSASDGALVTWSSSGIRGRLWEATGTGTVSSLGGACGISGLGDVATYSGTPVLGTTFSIELLAPTAPVLALIVGFSANPLACGPCTIVPSADILLAGSGPVSVNVPLDGNLVGFELFTQWLQLRASGCPILPTFGFSNTLKFTIAE